MPHILFKLLRYSSAMKQLCLLTLFSLLLTCHAVAKPNEQSPITPHFVQPPYPSSLEEEAIGGQVIARLDIDAQGRVRAMHVLSATHPLFVRSVESVIYQFRYIPATRDGQPVAASTIQIFRFIPRKAADLNISPVNVDHLTQPSQPSPTH